MILATDVHYHEQGATAAGVLFNDWQDTEPQQVLVAEIAEVAEYIPGQFYRRELPCLLALLKQLENVPDCIVIDGFVYLDAQNRAGLGKHLYDALAGEVVVIGVAKSAFRDSPTETALLRGDSQKPLYVTAAGIPLAQAKQHIATMHGAFRLPTLLKQVDRVCRSIR